jgi:hypothetical protein
MSPPQDLHHLRERWRHARQRRPERLVTPAYEVLRGHLAFFASRVDTCYVGGALVRAQPGGYYGGWITPGVVGPFKGEPGTEDW